MLGLGLRLGFRRSGERRGSRGDGVVGESRGRMRTRPLKTAAKSMITAHISRAPPALYIVPRDKLCKEWCNFCCCFFF